MKTINEVRKAFWNSYPEFKSEYRKTFRQNQYKCDIRVSFIDFVDRLRKDNEITEKLAQRVTL
ncbi:MAG: hypothetical protein AABY22_01315 [Nanoarchaeota archaeon]